MTGSAPVVFIVCTFCVGYTEILSLVLGCCKTAPIKVFWFATGLSLRFILLLLFGLLWIILDALLPAFDEISFIYEMLAICTGSFLIVTIFLNGSFKLPWLRTCNSDSFFVFNGILGGGYSCVSAFSCDRTRYYSGFVLLTILFVGLKLLRWGFTIFFCVSG